VACWSKRMVFISFSVNLFCIDENVGANLWCSYRGEKGCHERATS
jgi:hypothetical protein